MGSYEKEVKDMIEKGGELPKKLDIPLLKYFWQSSPLAHGQVHSIPRFLRKIVVLKNFTENELRILSKYLHVRKFSENEAIFRQGDLGIGLYFIYSGHVDVIVEQETLMSPTEEELPRARHVLSLEKFDYFGELALLQDDSERNATVLAREGCMLLGIFKPDLDELINDYPIVATKFLQSISIIITNRLFSITLEVRNLKYKIAQLEGEIERAKTQSN